MDHGAEAASAAKARVVGLVHGRSSFIRRNVTRFGNWTSAVAAKRQGERQLPRLARESRLGLGLKGPAKSRPRFQGRGSANLHSKDERRRREAEEGKGEGRGNMTNYSLTLEGNANFVCQHLCRPG